MRDGRIRLETARLHLRQLEAADVDAVLAYLARNRAFHAPFVPLRAKEYYSRPFWDRRAALDGEGYTESSPFHLYLFPKERPRELVGVVSFDNFVRGAFQACTLGYMLDESAQGRGYMAEALESAIRLMFREKDFHRIMASYLTDNERSARLLAKLGFVVEGTARAYLGIAGRWRDCVVSSLVNDEWTG